MMIRLVAPLLAADPTSENPDPFVLDGAKNLLEEAHFGIVNGKLTSGIPYGDVFSIGGLWAPPYASSDFRLGVALSDQPVKTERYTWRPFHVERTGSVQGIEVQSVTTLIPGFRGGLIEMTWKNPAAEPRTLPVTISVSGSLDRVEWWEFGVTKSTTATSPKVEAGCLWLEQGEQAIVLRASGSIEWDVQQSTGRGSISVPPSGSAKCYIAFTIGPTAVAAAECEQIMADPAKTMAAAWAAYQERITRTVPEAASI